MRYEAQIYFSQIQPRTKRLQICEAGRHVTLSQSDVNFNLNMFSS